MVIHEQIDKLYKFGAAEPEDHASIQPKVFAIDVSTGKTQLCIAASQEQVSLLETLLEQMPEPIWLLYVLVVPRGEGEAGRYQSLESLTREHVKQFLYRFRNFIETDGRHNLWLKSDSTPALLVCDRHNLIYGYDLVNEWSKVLVAQGWSRVERSAIILPDPHSHHYHQIFDDDARRILSDAEWQFSPLRDQDI